MDKPKDFKRRLDLFFPTPIYSSDLADTTNLNENLIKNIEEWKEKDKGIQLIKSRRLAQYNQYVP